jgi:hypothetical protein
VKFLVASGAKVGAEAMDGITPLHFACQKAHLETARALVAAGANPKGLTHKGENALHMAARGGSLEVVRAVLRRKVDPLHKSKRGERASDVARGDEKDEIREALAAAEEEKRAHLEATAEGRAAVAEEGEGGGPSIGPEIGPAIGPSIGPAIGPAIGPPAKPSQSRAGKRPIAEAANAPADALAAANGAKKKKAPILSFGDEDDE